MFLAVFQQRVNKNFNLGGKSTLFYLFEKEINQRLSTFGNLIFWKVGNLQQILQQKNLSKSMTGTQLFSTQLIFLKQERLSTTYFLN